MKIFDVLKNEKPVFVIDDIEDKKTKALITQINSQMIGIVEKLETFNDFADSQLEGDYNRKLVMAKSLQKVYSNWSTINNACAALVKEENDAIKAFEVAKSQLINNLNVLLKDCQKLPVVSAYDVFGDDFAFAKKGHSVVILGNNNIAVIETIIKELENALYVEGNYEKVEPVELKANYSNVEKNVKECKKMIDELYYGKNSKETKLLNLVDAMEEHGENLVFFATYKNDIKNIGCNQKEVDVFEKDLFKKYVPLKKQLSKTLKITFEDICDLSHDEGEFPTQEFSVINDETVEEEEE